MSGPPLELAKAALREALAAARPVDTFDVITFSGRTGRLFRTPRPASAANLELARQFVDGLTAGGGTEMYGAVAEALHAPVAADRHRYVFLMTDGYTGEEEAIARGAHQLVEAQKKLGRRARVFGVGIGSSPNSHLLSMLSKAGQGVPLHVHQPTDIPRASTTIRRYIDAPVLTDVAVDWHGMTITSLSPETVPPLFASRPATLHGRWSGIVPATVELRGRAGDRTITIPVDIVPSRESEQTLARLWARDRVDNLELAMAFLNTPDDSKRVRDEILTLGLQHRLVTSFTSFVAVDRSRRVDGPLQQIVQPVEAPAGVDPIAAGAVPVGGISRDFTAVVDMSPTSSRDAAGIRLGASTGAEARYVVDGQNITSPAYGTVGRKVIVVDDDRPLNRGFVAIEPHARPRVRTITAASESERNALQSIINTHSEAIARCFTNSPRATYRIHRKLTLVVRRGPDGKLSQFEIRTPQPLDSLIKNCLRLHLEPSLQSALRTPQPAELELSIWMRF